MNVICKNHLIIHPSLPLFSRLRFLQCTYVATYHVPHLFVHEACTLNIKIETRRSLVSGRLQENNYSLEHGYKCTIVRQSLLKSSRTS